jgi:hypothetical protein
MKQTESNNATPEQLLQILEAQLAVQRSQHAKTGRNRATTLGIGILFILIMAGGALLVLEQMLQDMRPANRAAASGVPLNSGK